jgi:hypothetical protein
MKNVKSKKGLWNSRYLNIEKRKMYADEKTAVLASTWLNIPEILVIEDWGCGYGGFMNYIWPHQSYIGIDGSNTKYADKIEDLVLYKTKVDAIHMRHVLEHNENWRIILKNFLESFTKRGVITFFTPFAEKETIIDFDPNWENSNNQMVTMSLPLDEIYAIIKEYKDIEYITEMNLITNSHFKIEHIFYFKKV